jgi:D-alanyl-D-alanine carboxypeptidase/Putative peptidoglycan binding domain
MARSISALRTAWKGWGCNEGKMLTIDFGPDRIRVVPSTKDAWTALAAVIARHAYTIRTTDTDSYNCRPITGGTGLSLHSFGIALDVNWDTNPYKQTANRRKVRFSNRRSQGARAADVKAGTADTDMTSFMIDEVRQIQNVDGRGVFVWGGDWNTIKDPMHFQVDLTPDEMARGVDWDTVARSVSSTPLAAFVRLGDVGPEVEYYQRKLVRLSPASPGDPDGKYGHDTAASVLAFQRSRRPMVREGDDGEAIGPWTRSELDLAEVERLTK